MQSKKKKKKYWTVNLNKEKFSNIILKLRCVINIVSQSKKLSFNIEKQNIFVFCINKIITDDNISKQI